MRRIVSKPYGLSKNFNPRTHVGCDVAVFKVNVVKLNFNPRTHVGCDYVDRVGSATLEISIHAPMWGATGPKAPKRRPRIFQSTHPCGVRQTYRGIYQPGSWISIHAPMWGATLWRQHRPAAHQISIHAPMWGATKVSNSWKAVVNNFNPRTHVGCDSL